MAFGTLLAEIDHEAFFAEIKLRRLGLVAVGPHRLEVPLAAGAVGRLGPGQFNGGVGADALSDVEGSLFFPVLRNQNLLDGHSGVVMNLELVVLQFP
ncbi:MAG: hypothetical protein JJE39_17595 [Vicinamibacteria bacterium]|nr:hypothetical protein [Vicinamibacteria bacterium]